MAKDDKKDKSVIFRRVRGRIVPIRVPSAGTLAMAAFEASGVGTGLSVAAYGGHLKARSVSVRKSFKMGFSKNSQRWFKLNYPGPYSKISNIMRARVKEAKALEVASKKVAFVGVLGAATGAGAAYYRLRKSASPKVDDKRLFAETSLAAGTGATIASVGYLKSSHPGTSIKAATVKAIKFIKPRIGTIFRGAT